MGVGHDMALAAAAAATSPFWGYHLLRTGKWRTDWPGRFGCCPPLPCDGRPTLLIHAVSVGEINAIRLLVDALSKQTDWHIAISTTTNTGIQRARTLYQPGHRVVRYPLDFSPAVKTFLDAVHPDLVALVELEVWPNFTELCQKRDIPLAVINGRLSDVGFSRYRFVRPLVRTMFNRLAAVAAQSQTYGRRFESLGVPRRCVYVLDTMKWDTAQIADEVPGAEQLADQMGIDRSRPLVVAGSTAPGEEELLIRTCPADAQLLLAPRKPEWFDNVAAIAPDIVRRTHHPNGSKRAVDGQRLFLLDTIGELRKAYVLADVAIVGRSFLGLFGSDMIEPIALGKPTITGPHHSNFTDTVQALVEGRGLVVTEHPGDAAADLIRDRDRAADLANRGRAVIRAHQGATQRHVELLKSLMTSKRS